MNITAETKLCLVIGDPVAHSRSPQLHNAGYEALGIDNEFVFAAAHVSTTDLPAFVSGIKVIGVRGVSCTAPHKEAMIPFLDKIDEVAQQIGAINTVVNDDGMLTGYNTDWQGVLLPLQKLCSLTGAQVALIGAGGAARAAAYGLHQAGAQVTVYNRTVERAQELASKFRLEAASLESLRDIKQADIIINSVDSPLLGAEHLRAGQIVFNMVYRQQSSLEALVKASGAQLVPGTEMLLYQGVAQFKLYTGHDAPEDAMRRAVEAL